MTITYSRPKPTNGPKLGNYRNLVDFAASFPPLTSLHTKADIRENAWVVIEASDDKHVEAYAKLVVAIQHLLMPGTETSPTEITTPRKILDMSISLTEQSESALQWL